MKPPHGLAAIKATYGDPTGLTDVNWRTRILVPLTLPSRLTPRPGVAMDTIYCHRAIIGEAAMCFAELVVRNEWRGIVSIGCYAFRAKRGFEKLSTHSWGIAFDVNAATNRLGTVGDISPGIVEVFESRGWRWGGRWKRRDPMHFQFATGY